MATRRPFWTGASTPPHTHDALSMEDCEISLKYPKLQALNVFLTGSFPLRQLHQKLSVFPIRQEVVIEREYRRQLVKQRVQMRSQFTLIHLIIQPSILVERLSGPI